MVKVLEVELFWGLQKVDLEIYRYALFANRQKSCGGIQPRILKCTLNFTEPENVNISFS